MSFRGLLRPGQGFRKFAVLRREGEVTSKGRPRTGALSRCGEFYGTISKSSPDVVERYKQRGTTVTNTIIQRGMTVLAQDNDVLELVQPDSEDGKPRRFLVHGDPRNPAELGHFLVYNVEERTDLK